MPKNSSVILVNYFYMKKIILASTSPRRKEILEMLDLEFEIIPSSFKEDNTLPLAPSVLVCQLALGKAKEVSKRNPDALVIGADTLMSLDGRIIGKPKDQDDARTILNVLSGRVHSVFSGIALVEGQQIQSASAESKVYFKKLEASEIEAYLKTNEWQDKAGGYGVQSSGGDLIEKIEGGYLNIVGLPLDLLIEMLKKFGVHAALRKQD
jgi:septum formation protein